MLNNVHGLLFSTNRTYDLEALTQPRCMSSVPFGGRFRLIDFMLSNMVNAGISDVVVPLQSRYQSLLDHLGSGKAWDLARHTGGMRLLPLYSLPHRSEHDEARGQMEVLSRIKPYLHGIRQDYVLLADGDIVINFSLEELYQRHIDSGADVTLACTDRYTGDPTASLYFDVDEAGNITDVIGRPMKHTGKQFLNIFLLSRDLLIELTEYCLTHGLYSLRDELIPYLHNRYKLVPYVFNGFSTRCTSVASYYETSMELLDPAVQKELFSLDTPIRTKEQNEAPTYYAPGSVAHNSVIGGGSIIEGEVENSIIFQNVTIEKGAKVNNCILFKGTHVQAGAELNHVITDKYVTISPNTTLSGAATQPYVIKKNSTV